MVFDAQQIQARTLRAAAHCVAMKTNAASTRIAVLDGQPIEYRLAGRGVVPLVLVNGADAFSAIALRVITGAKPALQLRGRAEHQR